MCSLSNTHTSHMYTLLHTIFSESCSWIGLQIYYFLKIFSSMSVSWLFIDTFLKFMHLNILLGFCFNKTLSTNANRRYISCLTDQIRLVTVELLWQVNILLLRFIMELFFSPTYYYSIHTYPCCILFHVCALVDSNCELLNLWKSSTWLDNI